MARPAYQERVIKEREELQEKIEKLDIWLRSDKSVELPPEDQFLLRAQFDVMKLYSTLLLRRIEKFAPDVIPPFEEWTLVGEDCPSCGTALRYVPGSANKVCQFGHGF